MSGLELFNELSTASTKAIPKAIRTGRLDKNKSGPVGVDTWRWPWVDVQREGNMRVAFLTNNLSPHGVSTIEEIAKRCEKLKVFVSSDRDEVHDFPCAWGDLDVIVQKSVNRFKVRRKEYGYWQAAELHLPYDTYGHLKRYDPDVILSGQFGVRTILAAIYKRTHRGKKLILWANMSEHTEARRSWIRRMVRRWIVRQIDGAIVNGKSGERYLGGLGFSGLIVHAPYAIDSTEFVHDAYSPKPNLFRLVYSGRLIPGKGVAKFCRTLARWCRAHPGISVVFRIVGGGPENETIGSLPIPANLAIEMAGQVLRDEVAPYYRDSDIFAFPTEGDEWGVVINEAMSSGLPILGSIYSGAVIELVKEKYNGWRFDSNSPSEVYDALDKCFQTTPQELVMMSRNSRDEIGKLTPQTAAQTIVELMKLCALAGREVVGAN
jgi:hypothetical protein